LATGLAALLILVNLALSIILRLGLERSWGWPPADGSPAAADWLRPGMDFALRPYFVLAVALTMASIALSSQSHFGGLSASLEQPYFYPECFLLCDWTGNRGHSSYALVRTAVLYPFVGHGHGKRAEWNSPVSTALWKTWSASGTRLKCPELGLPAGKRHTLRCGTRYGRDAAHD